MRWIHTAFIAFGVLIVFMTAFLGVANAVQLLSPMTEVFTVTPSEKLEGVIVLANRSDKPQSARIYQTDYRFNAKGQTFYEDPGTLVRSNAPWVKLGGDVVTVPAGKKLSVVYQISVPDDPSLSGTYWSMIMVEPLPPDDLEAPEEPVDDNNNPEEVKFRLQTVIRYGIQVVTNVKDSGEAELVLENPQVIVDKGSGDHKFTVEASNNGNLWVKGKTWLDLYDEEGKQVGHFEGAGVRIYPGTSVREQIDLGSLESGRYLAIFVIDGGGQNVFGARYNLVIGDGSK